MNLVQKLSQVSAKIGFVEFDARNSQFGKEGNNYASAAGVIRKLNERLAEVGVLAYPTRVDILEKDLVATRSGSEMERIKLRTTMIWTDGETTIETQSVGAGMDAGDKAIGKALTVAYKYNIAQTLALGWGALDVEQEEASSDKPTPKPRAPKATAPKVEKAEKPVKAPKVDVAALIADINAETFPNVMENILKPAVLRVKADHGPEEFERVKAIYVARKEALAA